MRLAGAACAGAFALAAFGQAPPAATEPLGALLYDTHCVSCHTTEVHWRDRKLATDWASLEAQVRRWQAATGLRWTDDEIAAVARHLNANYYHFPVTATRAGMPPPRAAALAAR